jgi:6,7-dimethyl-8-ribityllumazine synthase
MTPTVEANLDAKSLKIALVVSRFNDFITSNLLRGAEDFLERHGGDSKHRTIFKVPGSWEIPLTAKKLADSGKFDAVIGIGALIRGETPHFELLAAEVAKGLAQVGMESGVPVIFGVLTTDTVEQAIDRAGAKQGNKGWDAARSAVEMVNLFRQMA